VIKLVIPGPGAPELLPIDAWVALTSGDPVLAASGSDLAERLIQAGIPVVEVSGSEDAPKTRFQILEQIGHSHGDSNPLSEALAATAVEASKGGDVVVIEPDEAFRRVLMRRVLDTGGELEFVTGVMPRGYTLLEVVKTMTILHGPDGCPWDREQTHQTLAKSLLDETYELLEAIEHQGPAQIKEELGDLLLQVVFHAQMAFDQGTFDIDDVAVGLDEKLKRRHPHVFAGVSVEDSGEVVRNWDEIKRQEKGDSAGVFEGVPRALPALAYAEKLLRRADSHGHPVPSGSLEARTEDDLGEALMNLVAWARANKIDAESALRRAADRFRATIETPDAS
jgi:XTP/dITP diphosphohydrolase